ncbi:amidase signature domain-containing protein [Triangularia verruculosa]|uniref:Amidase signature domain-containing protein n=1 Tax=Triangularia verruculosa TaxID=2587418 RepID=A0AAN7AQB8_9PEZI|nr:amidase signature domain-containing protein [Triangularia verruculosa]
MAVYSILRIMGNLLLPLTAFLWFSQSPVWALNGAFDVREASIDSVHNALFTQITTCREIVSAFIARIEEYNPTVNAIISLNPEALSIADKLDERVASGNVTGSLFCIPVVLKDNYDAVGTNTTGACLDLAHNKPAEDAPTVTALRNAGAVILGKANLHEMALEGLTVSSLGGQTVNPYDKTRTPGGSSGGTGAAVASNFAIFGTGTDTVNSLRSPASAGSLFSFRPTRGLISRAGVIPVSFTQDAVGAIARNPKDLAVALTVMASVGFDPNDNVTALVPPEVRNKDYSGSLYGGSLRGLRFGFLNGFLNHTASPETTPVNDVMAEMVSKLKEAGVTVVNITEAIYNTATLAALDVQIYEFSELLDAYLTRPQLGGSPRPDSFAELYGSGKFLVIPSQSGMIRSSFVSSTANTTYLDSLRKIQNLTQALDATFIRNKLDALIYPQQKNLVVKIGSQSQSGRNGILAALTGRPVVHVPAGFSLPSEDAPIGVPIGMEILGRPYTEGLLLNIANHIAERFPVRRMPPFANGTVEAKVYETVPVIKPDTENIPAVYPIGVF